MKSYNRRKWLNPTSSSFTGSVVCNATLGKHGEICNLFLEIASCDSVARLHPYSYDNAGVIEMRKKVDALTVELVAYSAFLRKLEDGAK